MAMSGKSMKVVFLCKDSHKTMETVCNIIPPQSTADYHLIGLFDKEFFHWYRPRFSSDPCLSLQYFL